jgi:hypothetical protein
MAKTQSSFDDEDFDSETQVFLQQKTSEIKSLINQLRARPNDLQTAYMFGNKLVEVSNALKDCFKRDFLAWLKNEVLKEFGGNKQGTAPSYMSAYNYIYLYNYTNEYLGGVAGLKANSKISKTALYKLGLPGTSDEIKQKFAVLIKSGKGISVKEVDQAIDEHKAKMQQVDDDLNFGSDNRSEAQTNNHAIEVIRTHTKAQAMLAKLGLELCDFVWIAPDNRSESWQNERLGDLSIHELPKMGIDQAEQKIIPYIDVIWLGKNKIFKAVFEIECTTSIYSGLLRMTDLIELYKSLNFSFYIVVPEARVKKVKEQLSRPTFKALELDKKCKWIIIEELEKKWEEMMEWGTDPAIINRIAYSLIDE